MSDKISVENQMINTKKSKKQLIEELEQLLLYKKNLKNTLQASHIRTWEWNIQTGETIETIFNGQWAEVLGYSLDELEPISIKTWENLIHPDDLKLSNELLQKHFSKEIPFYDIECRMKHKDGHWVWVHDLGQVVSWTDDGKPIIMHGTHTDITERKKSEEALRESKNMFDKFTDAVSDVIYRYNPIQNSYDFISPSFETQTGYTLKELRQDPQGVVKKFTHPDDVKRIFDDVDEHIKKGPSAGPISCEYRLIHKNGSTKWVRDTKTIEFDEHGNLTILNGVVTDITERKKAEQNSEKALKYAQLAQTKLELLLKATSAVQKANNEREVLEIVVSTVCDTGWKSSCAHLFDNWQVVESVYVGLEDAEISLLKSNRPNQEQLKKIFTEVLSEFKISRSMFVPSEHKEKFALGRSIRKGTRQKLQGDSWDSYDGLYVPLYGHNDEIIGCIGLYDPIDGQRPDKKTCRYLESFADLIATTLVRMRLEKERRAAAAALNESKEHYRDLFNAGQDAITVASIDKDGRAANFVEVNDIACRMWGYTREELLNMSPGDLRDPSVPVDLVTSKKELEENGYSLFERMILTKDGKKIPMEVNAHLLNFRGQQTYISISRDITDRKQAEEALAKSEHRYQEIFNSVMAGIVIADMNSIIEYCNPAFAEIFDVDSINSLFEKSILDYIPDSQEEIVLSESDKRQKGESSQYELEIITAKDRKKIILVSAIPRYDSNGDFIGSFGSVLDITDRIHTERELLKSEERFKNLSNLTFEGILIHNNGVCIDVNESLIKLSGYTKEELIGVNIIDLFVPHEYQQIINENRIKNYTKPYEIMARKKDGTLLPIEIEARNIKNNDQEFRVLAIRDITDRKQAEENLKKSEEKFKTYIAGAPDGIFIVDAKGNYIEVNKAACDMAGYSKSEFINMSISDIVDPVMLTETIDGFELLKETGTIKSEFRLKRKDGSIILSSLDAVALSKDRFMAFCSDITDRKFAEETLREKEQFQKALLNDMKTFVAVLKPNGDVVFVNNTPLKVGGFELQDVICKKFYDAPWWTHSNEVWEMVKHDIEKCAAGESLVHDIPIQIADGSLMWIEFSMHPILDDHGNVQYLIPEGRDITERKHAEEALKDSEIKNTALLNAIPDIMFIISKDGTFLNYKSPSYEKLYTTPELFLNKKLRDVLPLNVAEVAEETIKKVFDIGGVHKLEYSLELNGKQMDYEARAVCSGDEQVLFIVCDITERKQAEVALKESEEHNRHIVESVQDVIYTISPDGIITSLSPSFETITGWVVSDLIGKPMAQFIHPDEAADAIKLFVSLLKGAEPVVHELRVRAKSGKYLNMEFHDTIVWKDGKVVEIIGTSRDITDRKQAEEKLHKSETILNEAQRLAQIGSWELDLITGRLYWSDEVYRIFDIDPQQFGATYQVFLDNIHPDDRALVDKAYSDSVKSKTPYDIVHRLLLKDGTLKIVNEHCETFYNDNGIAVRSIGTVQDITKLKQTEEKNVLLSRAIEQTDETIVITDAGGNIEYVNPAFEKITGYTAKEAIGQNPRVLKSGKHDDAFYKQMWEALSSGNQWNGELINRKKDGSLFTENAIISPVFNFQGEIINYVAAKNDITERKLAEKILKESESKYRTLFESSSQGVLVAEIETKKIVYANSVASLLFGYSIDKLETLGVGEIHPLEDLPYILHEFQLQAEGIKSMTTEIPCLRQDGTKFYADITTANTTFKGKECSVGFFTDVTDVKRFRELESRAERLEMAGTIAGQVAHDFNNLLAPIIAYPEFIRDDLSHDHSAHAYLDTIEEAAIKITEINQDLLTMGRRGHYNQEVININQIVQQTVKEMESRLDAVTCETDLCEDIMNIKGGSAQIHRMLTNLIVNARDAMDNIGVITIITENYYADDTSIAFGRIPKGEYVRLTISDNGCGIPDDVIQKILDPFFSTKAADKKRGSGLGLSVVDAVMRDHGGYIDLKTQIGHGTSFFLYFPISREDAERTASEQLEGGTEKILVVDDDDMLRKVSTKLLIKLGYMVSSVESGEKAVAFLRENPQDIIILDMVMPNGIDGAETYRQILENNSNQKAIIVSGFSESDRVLEAQQLGVGAFVKKPFTKASIAFAVRKELDRKS